MKMEGGGGVGVVLEKAGLEGVVGGGGVKVTVAESTDVVNANTTVSMVTTLSMKPLMAVPNTDTDEDDKVVSLPEGQGQGEGSTSTPLFKFFVGSLNKETTGERLRAYFSQFGTITYVYIAKSPITKVVITIQY